MRVLGISGRYRDAAAALAVDGQVVAAASEDCFTRVSGIGYARTGGFPSTAVAACLTSAGLDLGDIQQLTIVDDDGASGGAAPDFSCVPNAKRVSIEPALADAAQAMGGGAGSVLVGSTSPDSLTLFVRDHDGLKSHGSVPGGEGLIDAARSLAVALGVQEDDPFGGLDRLSVGGEPEFQDQPIDAVLGKARSSDSLADAASLNVRVQQARRSLAASFIAQVAQVAHRATKGSSGESTSQSIAFAGSMFAGVRLNTELRRLFGAGFSVAPVPEPAGRALGAAIGSAPWLHGPIASLNLGPSFTDTDIKRTLDNCRLDYVYEPDWARLFSRVSKMLAQGKVVGWFQGAMAFGPRSMGTRSILCDPSGRYARHNMNEYLRQAPLDEPLPVVFAPSAAGECLTLPVAPPLTTVDAAVNPQWRERLVSALDWRHCARVHTVNTAQAPQLCDLLEVHYKSTGVPALIETNLCEPGQPVACTPRDAVKTVYSSAIDALVLGRFLLMKDHWLLRSQSVD